jgi:hypothetical protein
MPVPRYRLRSNHERRVRGMMNNGLIWPGMPGRNDQQGRGYRSHEEGFPIQRQGA